ncbi:MAG: CHASE2 domain-containing protein [Hyphomicrobiaceae bacterium]
MAADTASTRRARRGLPKLRLLLGFGGLLCIAALLALPSFAPWLSRAEYWTADWRTAYLSYRAPTQHPRIAIVAINDSTLKDYSSSPIDRGLLAKIIAAIDAAGAKAIGIDVFFLKKTEPEKDAALVAAIRSAKSRIILGAIDERGALEPFQREFQTSFLSQTGRPVGYLNLRHESDDVVRYTANRASGSVYPNSFARLLMEADGAASLDDAGKPIAWRLQPSDGAETFLKIPAQDLFTGAAGDARLKDRIVLLGGDFPLRDRHRVPLTVRGGEPMTGVTIHAHILAGLLDPSKLVSELAPHVVQLILALVASIGFMLGWMLWRTTAVSFLGWSFASAVMVGIDAFCFVELRLLLPFTLALVAWVAGLTAGRSLHFVAEHFLSNRRSIA